MGVRDGGEKEVEVYELWGLGMEIGEVVRGKVEDEFVGGCVGVGE